MRSDVNAQVGDGIIKYVAAKVSIAKGRRVRGRKNEVLWFAICTKPSKFVRHDAGDRNRPRLVRYLENAQAMSPALKGRLHQKFVDALHQGESAVEDLLTAASKHVRFNEALTRNAIQASLLFGADVDVIAQVSNHVVAESYLRRLKSLSESETFDAGPGTADFRLCVETLERSRIQAAQLQHCSAGRRETLYGCAA